MAVIKLGLFKVIFVLWRNSSDIDDVIFKCYVDMYDVEFYICYYTCRPLKRTRSQKVLKCIWFKC